MHNIFLTLLLTTLVIGRLGICLESEKQRRYNQNADFLLHESSGNGSPQNKQLSPGKQNNEAQLVSSVSQKNSAYTGTSSKRDYVNPKFQNTHSSTGQREFVTPPTSPVPPSTAKLAQTPKRDFVNPQFTTAKPLQDSTPKETGHVHDLISYFDSKSDNGIVTPKPPSYSSILQGTTKHGSAASIATSWGSTKVQQPVTQSTLTLSQTPKSYSSIVSNSNKQTMNKGSTQLPNLTTNQSKGTSVTSRPATPQLPSAIVNNNKNNNQGSNTLTDTELQTLSEELLRKDSNNAARYVTVNYQEKTTSQSRGDKAPLPLLTITPAVWNIPTILKFVPLLDNYEKDTLINEYVTPQERNEENAFMDAIMSTAVIRHLMIFLKDKGYVTPDPRQQRDFLKQLWFGLYSRGKGKISSSGFEHIFVSELKNGEVLGLHNWIYFAREESANRVNYLGYLKYVPLNDKGVVMKLHFNQNGVDKPVDSMFIGTSPELEIALYTLCFITRANDDCKLKLNNKDITIISHTFRYRSKDFIGSAYPQI